MAVFRFGGYLLSAGVHVAVFSALFVMKKPEPTPQNVAVIMSQAKKKAKPKKEPPPKPIEAPKEILQRPLAHHSAPPPPVAAPPPDPVAAAHPALAGLPDFGISLTGGGPGGIAIPMGGGAPQPAAVQPTRKEKVLGAAAERPATTDADGAQEELVKAKVSAPVQPTYTDDARAAGIEGRVVVEVSLDEAGQVTSVKVLRGLGHGLDESAIAAAKRMTFTPATRGGKPVKSTFVLSLRFVLGD